MKKYNWKYTLIKQENSKDITRGEWMTALPASIICKYFEILGYHILELRRVEYNTATIFIDNSIEQSFALI